MCIDRRYGHHCRSGGIRTDLFRLKMTPRSSPDTSWSPPTPCPVGFGPGLRRSRVQSEARVSAQIIGHRPVDAGQSSEHSFTRLYKSG